MRGIKKCHIIHFFISQSQFYGHTLYSAGVSYCQPGAYSVGGGGTGWGNKA